MHNKKQNQERSGEIKREQLACQTRGRGTLPQWRPLFSLPLAQCSSMVCPPARSPEQQEQKRKTRMTSCFTQSDSSLLLLLLIVAGRGRKSSTLPHRPYHPLYMKGKMLPKEEQCVFGGIQTSIIMPP